MKEEKKIYFIVVLRVIGVLLITNSHFDGVYPWPISFGGAPGVATFFLVTGFLLANTPSSQSFASWYKRKLVRLYPSIWISSIILVIIGYISVASVNSAFNVFVYPTHWWYIKNLLIMYILFYFSKKMRVLSDGMSILLWSGVYLVFFILQKSWETFFVDSFYFRLCYGMIAMHLGSMLRTEWEKGEVCERPRRQALKWVSFSALSMFCFLVAKLLIGRVNIAYYFQFVVHIASVCFAFSCCRFLMLYEQQFKKRKDDRFGKLICLISESSLEIYLIQQPIIDELKSIVFPANLICIVLAIVSAGCIIHLVSNLISRRLRMIGR